MKDKKNNCGILNVWLMLALLLSGFVLYFIPLQSKAFYYDDHFAIENNDVIKHIDIPRIFDAFNTRFLVGLSFALNYKWSALHPAGYRIINLLIHCLNAFLVYLLIKSTLGLLRTEKSEWPAVFASMLFLCHPIQTEPVNSITQRFVLMGTFFYLLTLVLYVEYRCRSQKRYLIASFGSAIAAMFCKEFVVTLPLMLALYEFYFLKALAGSWWRRCSRLLPFFVIALIVPLLLLRTPPEAIGVANIADSDFSHIDITRAHGSIGREHYFLTELNVVCTYVRLLFLPFHQNFDYDYPISNHVDTKTALCGIFLLGLLALAAVTYKSNRLISFSILWFFIALSVESSFIPIAHVIAEYRVYLASVGFAFLVTALIYRRQVDVKRLNIIAAIILMGFSIVTLQRNKVWKSELALWNDTVPKSPHKARPYCSRGFLYNMQGKLAQAMSDYNKAIEIDPSYAMAYDNRGGVYYRLGKLTRALSDYNKAIELEPKFAKAYFNRGNFYHHQGNLPQAIADYTKAIEIIPTYSEAYNYRGNTYADQGNLSQAIVDYTKAIEINPDFADAYNNRGTGYGQQGNLYQAIADFSKAIDINPNFAAAYYNRGFAYYYGKEYDMARADVGKAEELGAVVNPNFIKILNNAS